MYLDFFSLYFFFWIRQSFSWKGQETLSCGAQEIPPAVFPVEQRSRADVCPWVSTMALSTSLSTNMRQTRITRINLEHTLLLLPLAGESASTCWAQCWELRVTVCKEGTSLTWWGHGDGAEIRFENLNLHLIYQLDTISHARRYKEWTKSDVRMVSHQ